MNRKMKLLIVASFLALAGTPFLYAGGQNDSNGMIGVGFILFCCGMGMVLALKFFAKPGSGKTPPSNEGKTS
jgi:hypothetical protein